MREILFRGKPIHGGKMVEGYFECYRQSYNGLLVCFIAEWGKKRTRVNPKTVGQYTGLKDKNGKRIFEGDIVKHDFGADQIGVQYAVVEYDDKYAAFMIKPLHDWMFCCKSDCEVIGNIHDNPELLEVT